MPICIRSVQCFVFIVLVSAISTVWDSGLKGLTFFVALGGSLRAPGRPGPNRTSAPQPQQPSPPSSSEPRSSSVHGVYGIWPGKNYLNLGGLFFFLYLIYDFLGSSGRSLRRCPAMGDPQQLNEPVLGACGHAHGTTSVPREFMMTMHRASFHCCGKARCKQ